MTSPPTRPAGSAEPPPLPDINAQTYPFEVVQALLDRAAYFHLLSVPGPRTAAIRDTGGGVVVGWRISERLQRFRVDVRAPSAEDGLRARQLAGEEVAAFDHSWLLIPEDFQALPGREPPATALDPSRSQRFVMLDGVCRFGEGEDGFRSFGTGSTFPSGDRRRVLAAAVGTLIEGFGKFRELDKATYVCCGTLSVDGGFRGSLMLRVMDPEEALHTRSALPPLRQVPDPEPGVTYLVLHGRKKGPASETRYRTSPQGRVIGLEVHQELTIFPIDCSVRGRRGLESRTSICRIVGRMTSEIDFNLLDPGAPGTPLAPIPFAATNHFTLVDGSGRTVGTFVGDGGEGRTFTIGVDGAPGQKGLRFGGFGPLRDGTGCFEGVRGLMTDNSVVGLAPHVTSTLYVLRVEDSEGRYRAALGQGE